MCRAIAPDSVREEIRQRDDWWGFGLQFAVRRRFVRQPRQADRLRVGGPVGPRDVVDVGREAHQKVVGVDVSDRSDVSRVVKHDQTATW